MTTRPDRSGLDGDPVDAPGPAAAAWPRVAPGAGAGARGCACGSANWFAALRAYLAVVAGGNLAWETAHLPLYTIWRTGTAGENAFAVLHCAGGDLLIALASLVLALVLAGDRTWPARRFGAFAAPAVASGLAYTVFSEWLNVDVRGAWDYSDLMPVVRVFGFDLGLSPPAQWVVVPLIALRAARARSLSRATADHPRTSG